MLNIKIQFKNIEFELVSIGVEFDKYINRLKWRNIQIMFIR